MSGVYGANKYSGNKYAPSGEGGVSRLPGARRAELLEETDDGGGLISDIAWLLDTPGAMVRGALSGTGALDALTQTAEERTTGRELLRQANLVGDEDNWGNFFAGIGAEVALDPLSLVSGPVNALTKSGKLASKAGLLARAPELLSRQFLATGGKGMSRELAERAAAGAAKSGRKVATRTDVAGRPLVGRRAAQRYGTLQNLVDYADDPQAARRALLEGLRGNEVQLERLLPQTLGRDVGIGLPTGQARVAFNVPGGAAYSDAMDALTSGLRWGPIGRTAAAIFDKNTGQALDAESQAIYAGANQARGLAEAEARRESAYQAAKLFQSAPEAFTEEGNRAIGRLIERPADNKFQAVDDVFASKHPAARQYVDWWRSRSEELADEFTEAGLRGARFADPNISGYLPRQADGMLRQYAYNDPALRRELSTITSDQMRRTGELMVPGGRDTIAFDLSKDSFVAGGKRGARTDEEAATHIAQKLYGTPTQEQLKQSRGLAQILHKLPDEVVSEVPLFGQHPVQTISRYIQGRAGARATMEAIYDSLAGSTNMNPANLAEGGRHISINEALQRVGGRSVADEVGEVGAREHMRRRIGQLIGADADKVDLSTISVPEELVAKLTKAREAFESPEAALEFMRTYQEYIRSLKSGLLAWPSRINRDLMSGAYSNWLENALDVRSLPAVKQLAKAFVGGAYATGYDVARYSAFDPKIVSYLKTMPRYASVPTNDVAAQFYADLAAGGLLDVGRSADNLAVVNRGNLAELLPGVEPQTFVFGKNSAVGELFKKRNWKANPLDPDFWRADTNPISRAGAKAGELSDMVNRLTGYMSLLRQGVEPMEAARRMKRAHVDYASLSPVEKAVRDIGIPFYAFASRILKEVSRQMLERPGGRYGQGIRLYERMQESNEEEVPEQLRRQFAVAIDPDDPLFGWMADQDGTSTTYFSDLDLPGYDQLNMIQPGSLSRTAGSFAQMLSPPLRVGYEALSGRDLFFDSPINEVSRGYGPVSKLSRYVTGDDTAGTGKLSIAADKLTDLVPYASRPLRALTGLLNADNKLPLSTNAFVTAFNQAGAGKLRDVTAEDIRRGQIERLQRLAAPYTREYTIPSIPKGLEGRVPQDAVDALSLAREIQREGRQLRRRRLESRYSGRY